MNSLQFYNLQTISQPRNMLAMELQPCESIVQGCDQVVTIIARLSQP